MNIVIPLGGMGKRFKDLGYNDPKPLIKVAGKEIIFYNNILIRIVSNVNTFLRY